MTEHKKLDFKWEYLYYCEILRINDERVNEIYFICEKLKEVCQAIDELREESQLQENLHREVCEAISNGVIKSMNIEESLTELKKDVANLKMIINLLTTHFKINVGIS